MNEVVGLRLSPQQEYLWLLQERSSAQPYRSISANRIEGRLQPAALEAAVARIAERHEILRTVFRQAEAEGQPVQVVTSQGIALEVEDLASLAPGEQQERMRERYLALREEPFDLERKPPVRMLLLSLDERQHVLLVSLSSLCGDARSLSRIVTELGQLYAGHGLAELDPEPFQYIDFSEWQHELLESAAEDTEIGRAFWGRRELPLLEGLPFSGPRAGHQGFTPRLVSGRVERRKIEAIRAAIGAEGTPFPVLLLTLWQILCQLLVKRPELVVGAAFDGRKFDDLQGGLGLYVRHLPVPFRAAPGTTLPQAVAIVRENSLQAHKWQEYFSWKLVNVTFNGGGPPYFPLCFEAEEQERRFACNGLAFEVEQQESYTEPFQVKLACRSEGAWIVLEFQYDSELMSSTVPLRLLGMLEALVDSALAFPDAPITELSILGKAERHQLLNELNEARHEQPESRCAHQLFEAWVERSPSAVAVRCGGQSLTYAELESRSNRLANRLLRLGVGPDVVVAVALERSIDMVAALLGVLKAGGAYLPLDPSYPHGRLAFMLEDSAAPVLVTVERLAATLPAHNAVPVLLDQGALDEESDTRPPGTAVPESLAYVIYTSGSTGTPKGVSVPHANVVRLLRETERWFAFGPEDVWTLFHSYAFDFSVWELWGALAYGGRLVVVPQLVSRSPDMFLGLLAAERVTFLNQTPSAFRNLVWAAQRGEEGRPALALRTVVFGGEALDLGSLEPWFDRYGDRRPRLVNMYGITETTVHVTYRPLASGDLAHRSSSVIGGPIPDLTLHLLDQTLQLVPIGVPGEIFVGGAGLARGYLDRPDLSAERFLPDPFSQAPGARLYRSGDLARRLPDGDLEYLGRIDHQVKIRGFRIELGEIESALEEHPGVRKAVVLADGEPGRDPRLIAYVVVADPVPTPGDLLQLLRDKLPAYMVPAAVIPLASLPLTSNGKVDWRALPTPESLRTGGGLGETMSITAELLAGIWSEVLGVDQVGARDNFFHLGGHSLLATQVASRLREVFRVELPLRTLFQRPVLEDLARELEAELSTSEAPSAPPITRVSRDEDLPLSFAQQRLWFLDQLDPGSSAYNIPVSVAIEGALDVAALRHVLAEIARRHETLRTTFAARRGEPVQVVGPASAEWLPEVDLSALGEAGRDEAYRLAAERARRPFDLARGPLARLQVVRLGEGEHVLMGAMHHIISDGWSIGVLMEELRALYEAFRNDQVSPLPELPVQYADYAHWQRRWLRGEVLEGELGYWRERLAGAPAVLELPTDRPRSPQTASRSGRRDLDLSEPMSNEIRALARRCGATPFMLVLAAFQLLLARYSGQDDISVGTPVAGRNRIETERMIGFFVNTLVLRSRLSWNAGFIELLDQVREATLDAQAHQDFPFEKLVEELQPERNLGSTPLFQVLFVFQNTPRSSLELETLRLRRFGALETSAKFDLTLSMSGRNSALNGTFEYSTGLFDDAAIDRMAAHFRTLFDRVLEDPARSLSSLEMLTEGERLELLQLSRGRRVERADPVSLEELLAAQARRYPERQAVVDGREQISYGELDRRVARLARHLSGLGLSAEDLVAISLERSIETITALLAVLKAGGAYVPIEPTAPLERLKRILDSARPRVLITDSDPVEASGTRRVPFVIRLDGDRLETPSAEVPAGAPDPERLAYVMYTSGSTGEPKGVMVTRRCLARYAETARDQFSIVPEDRILQFSTLSSDISVEEIFPCLITGATLVLRSEDMSTSASLLLEGCRQAGITVLDLPTASWHELVIRMGSEGLALPPSIRLVIIGGERALGERVASWQRNVEGAVRLINSYGPTETTVVATLHEFLPGGPEDPPIGRAIPDVEALVLDSAMRLAPNNVPGELYIGGAGVARGYFGASALTAERFVPNPFSDEPGARLYRTGDLVRRRPDGTLEFVGRKDSQIKLQGYRVELEEIEAVLIAHPAITAAAVTLAQRADGERRLVAYIVSGEPLTTRDLRAFLQPSLPAYMLPSSFVRIASLPMTVTGKIDRRALPAEPEKETDLPVSMSLAGELLGEIWAEVLGRDRIGPHDNFFHLGGHSLLATQVVSRVREAFGVEVPLRTIFVQPVLEDLTREVERLQREDRALAVPLTRVRRDQDLPLSFAQQRLWFLHQLEPGSPAYNIPVSVRLQGDLDTEALRKALEEIATRHEVLRTIFVVSRGEPVQVVMPVSEKSLTVVDLSGLAEVEREGAARRLVAEEARRPFDLACGPLTRLYLLRLGESDHVLTGGMHHSISDGWSIGVLLQELRALYDAYCRGQASPLPELPVQYADYAHWQRSWLQGKVLAREIGYWREQLSGAPAVLELPTDRSYSQRKTSRSGHSLLDLSESLSDAVRALARRRGATPFMVLLASFQMLLSRYSGQQDISVGTPIAGRTRMEIERLIGFFVNTLVLRSRLSWSLSFLDLLDQVRETALEAQTHQELPFEKLVEELQPERNLEHPPLFQVLFVFQNTPSESMELEHLRLHRFGTLETAAQFDLSLAVSGRSQTALQGAFEYNADLFDAATIGRLATHFHTLLQDIVSAPERCLSSLDMFTERECQELLDLSQGRRVERMGGSMVELFAVSVNRHPDKPAVLFGESVITYGELDWRANRLARQLVTLGVSADELVAIVLERSTAAIVALLATLKAGGAYVPIDPAVPPERFKALLSSARPRVLLTDNDLLEASAAGMVPFLIRLERSPQLLESGADAEPPGSLHPEQLAYVMYTSGSTGGPKGVMVPHRCLAGYAETACEVYSIEPGDRILQFSSLSSDISVEEIFSCLAMGATLVLRSEEMSTSVPRLLESCRRNGVTILILPTAFWHELVVRLDAEGLDLPPSLRAVIIGGERALGERLATWHRRVNGSAVRLINGYGPTETTVVATSRELLPYETGDPPIGRAIPGAEALVLDSAMRLVPHGVSGELHVGGTGVSRGYLREPALTAERFVPDPFSMTPGGRLYRTGDLVRRRPGGDLEFIGRMDAQIKVQGYRVELEEIEAALAAHPGIAAAVVAMAEAGGTRRLVAYIVCQQPPAAKELRVFLQARLPAHMIPSTFVSMTSLPLTVTGKVNRRALPSPESRQEDGEAREAMGVTAELLSEIWAEVLGRERIGQHDNFFHLGGHSLLATQVVSRVREAFRVEMPLRTIFVQPVLEDLAREIEGLQREGRGLTAPPLVRLPRGGPLPLSFAQQRLWFLDQLEPDSPAYNIPIARLLEGTLDVQALAWALAQIVRRHEALRTRFQSVGGEPEQVIQPAKELDLPVVDLSGLPDGPRRAEARWLVQTEALRPFDLTGGYLLRSGLLCLGPSEHVAVLTMHHIVSDGWSINILVRELTALYTAFSMKNPLPLPELPIQYADYAAWQRSWLQGEVLEQELAHWRNRLAGSPPMLELPMDRPRPALRSLRGASQPLILSAMLTRELNLLARREGATLFMVLLAAFQALLARFSGQLDLNIGSPVAGRSRIEVEGVIGFFVNTLVLRADLSEAPSFSELLRRAREEALSAHMHQEVPFERLVEELRPQRSLSHTPLFQVMLVLQNTPREAPSLGNGALRLSGVPGPPATAKFDLTLGLTEREGRIEGVLTYDADLFDAPTAVRLLSHFEALLARSLAEPHMPVLQGLLLHGLERHQLLVEWNDTRAAPRGPLLLHDFFEAQVEQIPDAVAVSQDGATLSYRDLDRRANHVAFRLRRLGVAPDVVVGVYLGRSFELIEAVLGILKAGGAWLPLDPELPSGRIALMLEDAQVRIVATCGRLRDELPPSAETVICLDGGEAAWTGAKEQPCDYGSDPASLAYVLFTSGSTGRPKGVMVSHAAIVNHMQWMQSVYPMLPEDCALQKTPIGFDASVGELFAPLLVGARLAIALPGEHRDPAALLGRLRTEGVTVLHLVPSLLQALLEQPGFGEGLMLRRIQCGGEPLAPSVRQRVQARVPADVVDMYGPTEAAIHTSSKIFLRGGGSGVVSIGHPIENARVTIVGRGFSPVPIGAPGELLVGGPLLARGYVGRPDLTAERFVPDPFGSEPGERLYRTGDLVRWLANGELEFLGRIDHQVKVRGFRIELGEVESVLAIHPEVREAVVVVRQDRSADKRLIAYVTTTEAAPAAAVLRAFLRERLPDYMVPSRFVHLDDLPRTPGGKVDRKALPAPDAETGGPAEGHVEPRTPVEELVVGIWADLLHVKQVGIDDDFFELGGHSLLATQVVSRLRDTFAVELPLRRLFEAPTVGRLAREVEKLRRGAPGLPVPPLVRVPRDGRLPLSFAQQRLWFLDQLAPGSPAYNIPAAFPLRGELTLPALARSFTEVVRRHEVLRTVFRVADGEPLQVILPPPLFELPEIDLSGLPEPYRASQVRALAADEAMRPYNLARGPLLRAAVLRLDRAGQFLLLATLHHIVSDGWSMDILLREVSALYTAFALGQPSPLLDLPIQYADYASWQRQWLQGEVLERELRYWQKQLAGAPPVLELPGDRPRPFRQTFRGAVRSLELSETASDRVRALGRSGGVTPFMVLLAAFQVLLSRYSREDDISVGSPIAGRTRTEIEPLIGLFVNTLVLRTRVIADLGFRRLLDQVREVSLQAYAHQELPFEKLVEELQPERSLSRPPLVQVLFLFQDLRREDAAQAVPSGRDGAAREGVREHRTTAAKFDLTLALAAATAAFTGSIEYNSDLFDPATIDRMTEHFQRIVEVAVSDLERPVGDLEWMSEGERFQLLTAWNVTEASVPGGLVHELVSEQARRAPKAVAVEHMGERLTYQELEERAGRLALRLRQEGVGQDALVGAFLDRSPRMLVGLLGILKAGGAYVPLDPAYPRERLSAVLDEAKVAVLLTEERLLPDLPASGAVVVSLEEATEGLASRVAGAGLPDLTPENLAYVIFTSGSTGRPKGVQIAHGALMNFLESMRRSPGLTREDVLLAVTTLSFDIAGLELWLPMLAGARIVLADRATVQDASRLVDLLTSCGATVMQATPATWRMLIEAGWRGDPGLRALCGGEALTSDLASGMIARVLELWNLYGPTEATIWSTARRVEVGEDPVRFGGPIANTEIYVLDRQLSPVPVGVPGELYIAGEGLSRGYLGRPDLTAASFIPDPFGARPGGRLYQTGDLVRYRPDGSLLFLGRSDYQVKVRGFRIELGEIEAALGHHPAVLEAAALVQEPSPGDRRLAACFVASDPAPSAAELRSFLQRKLPEYMVPSLLLCLERLPRMPNGKLDRRSLAALEPAQAAGKVAPRNSVELLLSQMWEELLDIPAPGVTESFFTLGGHSLLATRLISRIESTFGLRLPVATLFEHGTIEQLAAILRQESPAAGSPLVALRQTGSRPPLFWVHPAGGNVVCYLSMARYLGPDQPFLAFQSRGLVSEGEPEQDLRSIAADYAGELRSRQPTGPYLLAGWSMGGLVAFEMARQLRHGGESVPLLVAVDSYLPAREERHARSDEAHLLLGFARELDLPGHHLDALRGELRRAQDLPPLLHLLRLAREAGALPADLGDREIERLFRIYRANIKAMQRYEPGAYPGRVLLVHARERSVLDPAEAWREHVGEGLEVHELAGDHFTLLREPNVQALADLVRAAVDQLPGGKAG